jgi:hypothetical protein
VITVPLFDVEDPSSKLNFYIVGVALFIMYDNKWGSFVICIAMVASFRNNHDFVV